MPRAPKPRVARIGNVLYQAGYMLESVIEGYIWTGHGRKNLTPDDKLKEMKKVEVKLSRIMNQLSDEIIRYEKMIGHQPYATKR